MAHVAADNVKQMDSALGALVYAALQENATKPPATYQSVAKAVEDALRSLPPYERLSIVGLTVVTVHRDGESWDEVQDKKARQ